MKPVYQTREGFPLGNCTEACIASVFEIELDDVPIIRAKDETWIDELNVFLRHFGVYAISLQARGGFVPTGYHLIGGKSPRGGFGHYVVGLNGEVVHDPHRSGLGIETQEDYLVFVLINPKGCMARRSGVTVTMDPQSKKDGLF